MSEINSVISVDGKFADENGAIPLNSLDAINLKLTSYPNTRDDGALTTNKVLTTDTQGNLKMCSIAVQPAPFLSELIPDSYLPSNTGNFILKGSFFTPTMTVSIVGQIINYVTFKSDNEILVNATTGSAEGSFAVTLNNGISQTFPNALLIVLGDVFKPTAEDWLNVVEPIEFISNEVLTQSYGVKGSGVWDKELDYTKNFRVSFKLKKSPLGNIPNTNVGSINTVEFLNISDSTLAFGMKIIFQDSNYHKFLDIAESTFFYFTGNPTEINTFWNNPDMHLFEFRKTGANIYMYYNGVSKGLLAQTLTQNTKLRISAKYSDVYDIKYIELAT